jgi:cysteinyl-tRNA synthetase
VIGNGGLTLRRNGSSVRYESGTVLPLTLDAPAGAATAKPVTPVARNTPAPTSIRAVADQIDERFRLAFAGRDIDECVACILELEQSIVDWTADTEVSDDADHARALLRGMIARLSALAGTALPFVEALVALREKARKGKDFAGADEIRALLAAGGVEVRDTPDGPQWTMQN